MVHPDSKPTNSASSLTNGIPSKKPHQFFILQSNSNKGAFYNSCNGRKHGSSMGLGLVFKNKFKVKSVWCMHKSRLKVGIANWNQIDTWIKLQENYSLNDHFLKLGNNHHPLSL